MQKINFAFKKRDLAQRTSTGEKSNSALQRGQKTRQTVVFFCVGNSKLRGFICLFTFVLFLVTFPVFKSCSLEYCVLHIHERLDCGKINQIFF